MKMRGQFLLVDEHLSIDFCAIMAQKTSEERMNISQSAGTTSHEEYRLLPRPRRMTHSFHLIWLDANITSLDEKSQHSLQQLRTIVSDLYLFSDSDQCVNFVTDIRTAKMFLIISGSQAENVVPRLHPITQVAAVYIFCEDKQRGEEWTRTWHKVKGVYTTIEPIYEALQTVVKRCDEDSISVSIARTDGEITTAADLNQLESSFMYTQLFKNAVLDMEYNDESRRDLITYCEVEYADNPAGLALIEQFRREYRPEKAIWWYTRPIFTFQMVNRALRLLEADMIVSMAFFIHDLHRQIQQLHTEQISAYEESSFVVYRGQGLSISKFEKLRKSQGGLMSFNGFLSTSRSKPISSMYAESVSLNETHVGILFVMTIDPKIASYPFANIRGYSYFQRESEILFSMHTVFRINDIRTLDDDGQLFEVQLALTTDDDPQLRILTQQLVDDLQESIGWNRIGNLLMQVEALETAEQLYQSLLEQAFSNGDAAVYNSQLARIKVEQGDYQQAIRFSEKAQDIYQNNPTENSAMLAACYSNIGFVYLNTGEYEKALSFFEKALDIHQNTLPDNHPSLATSYGNVASVYSKMNEYEKALTFFEKTLDIYDETLPENHPSRATIYNNIGLMYLDIREHSKALSFLENALNICQKTSPENHTSVTSSYNNIGMLYLDMGEYSKALSFLEKALNIRLNSLPENHPSIATSYNNIGLVYYETKEYSQALSYFEKALKIRGNHFPENHPDLAATYGKIASVYSKMEEYSQAISCYEKVLDIHQKTLSENDYSLGTSNYNIALAYLKTEDYSKALHHWNKALDIYQKTLPESNPLVTSSCNNIGMLYMKTREYSKALSFLEKALNIRLNSLPENHPSIATSYNNIGLVYYETKEYSQALSYFEKALSIYSETVPRDEYRLQTLLESIEFVKEKLLEK
jgi:tetratricopeptide (TPR) repeat protein